MLTIALYEEHDLMRGLLLEWLNEAGYRALAPVPEGEQVALVIASVSMPRDAGLQQLERVRAAHPQAPIIALSAQFRSGLSAVGASADSLGVRRIIAKPLAREELLKAVRAIIGGP